ncbi:MAG: hypothetical protein KTR21_18495, partial [Rhodobacteraceae bacterium]|nr:hypothetical protein [Paracoccaceae bacterium]
RRITHITEVLGLEGDTIVTQDVVRYEIQGEDRNGKLIGRHTGAGVVRPNFYERARSYGLADELTDTLARMDSEAE